MATPIEIATQFPFLHFLAADPEVGPLLASALNPDSPYSEDRFRAELMNTNWWKNRSSAARERESLYNTDPATFWANERLYSDQLRGLAWNMGLNLTEDQVVFLRTAGQNLGATPDSPTMMQALRQFISPQSVMTGGGKLGSTKVELESLIKDQWFQPIASADWLANKAADIAFGITNIEGVNAELATQAWNMFPHLRQQIEAGQTMADIFNPYRQLISDELELGGMSNVSVMPGSEWRSLFDWRDPPKADGTAGNLRLPTESEVRKKARNRSQWWETSAGRQADATATSTALRMFGIRAM